jgi:hypothetical protein
MGLMEIEEYIRYPPLAVGLMEIENLFRYPALAVGLMEIENLIRYTERAVGLKPSAMQGEARLRGLHRIIYSKTISPRLARAKPACAGWTGRIQTYRIRVDPSYPCRSVFYSAMGLMEIEEYIRYPPLAVGLMEIENLFRYPALAVGLKPSASQGEARLRGL